LSNQKQLSLLVWIFWIFKLQKGAYGGIGESLALEYSKNGVNIILLGRNEEKLKLISEKCSKKFQFDLFFTLEEQMLNISQ
jgi:NADP-dependent 3-hydroxy acid dehydrogenase YdfG